VAHCPPTSVIRDAVRHWLLAARQQRHFVALVDQHAGQVYADEAGATWTYGGSRAKGTERSAAAAGKVDGGPAVLCCTQTSRDVQSTIAVLTQHQNLLGGHSSGHNSGAARGGASAATTLGGAGAELQQKGGTQEHGIVT
jgi:hypothetical protein